MQYGFMPRLMWAAFAPGFKAALPMITDFTREYTLASGGPYCDCHYKKRK